ncbi:amidohydrolase family protein [Candidatus Bipolaricaulota bacterium]
MKNPILIQHGTIVTASDCFGADIRIEDGRIAEVELGLSSRPNETVLDATGLLVLPGGVDPHVHLTRRPSASPTTEDLESSSRAALAGGVTTVGEIASADEGEGVIDIINRVERCVRSMAIVDVFVHPVLGSTTCKPHQIDDLSVRGQPSLKIFLMNPETAADPVALEHAVQRAATAGLIVLFHCEHLPDLLAAEKKLRSEGKTSLRYLPESRPKESEIRATAWAIDLCRKTGATGYIVHISCSEVLALTTAAREEGVSIYTETRPEFLYLTSAAHRGRDAKLHVIIPPLRDAADCQALWDGIGNGSIDVVATDDAPFWTKEEKLDAPDDFQTLHMGVSGLQLLRPMLFSEGVLKKRITLRRFVDVTATAPAKLFGLYPQKGEIAVGSDADLVLWDPKKTRKITQKMLLSRTGFSLYEGLNVTGWPQATLRRGEIVFADGEVLGRPGTGELIARGRRQSGTQSCDQIRPA